MIDFIDYVRSLPKAELHLHIEGTLEPEMLIKLAEKHQVDLPYSTAADVARAYEFEDLQSFLDLYYLGASVLVDEDDFYLLMLRYLERCRDDGIVHTEMMFDPQTHTERGIDFAVFMEGFSRAMEVASREWGRSSALIMCFLRHLSEESAFETLKKYTFMMLFVSFRGSVWYVGGLLLAHWAYPAASGPSITTFSRSLYMFLAWR